MIKINICITTIILIYILLFILKECVYAENNVLINEFVIDPQPQQIELLNIGSSSADISGWYLDDNGGTTFATIPQNTILYPNSCYIYFGDLNLNKSSADTVRLFNNTSPPTSSSAQLIDFYTYKSSPGTGIGFSRIPDGQNNWLSTNSTIGLFNENNLSCIFIPTTTPTPTSTPSPTPSPTPNNTPTPTIQQFNPTPSPTMGTLLGASNETPTPTNSLSTIDNVFLSEVMIHPKTGEKEWIELFNNNDFNVDLVDWYIDDGENTGSTPKKFSTIILAKSYYIFEFSSSIFNNDSDQVRLLDQNKLEKDSFEYNASQENISYGRVSFDLNDFCLQEPSKRDVNNSCINPTTTSIPTTSLKTITPTSMLKTVVAKISSVRQTNPNNQYPLRSSGQAIIKQFSPSILLKASNFQNNQEEVLGISTMNDNFYPNKLIKLFSLLSFLYSFLTIIYILIKMKLSYESSFRIYPSSFYPKRRK